MVTVGIDIGTSYSSISLLEEDGKAQPVRVSNGACIFGDSYSIPSAVYINEDGNVLIGQLALSARMKNPSCYKGEFKRDLGQQVPYILGEQELMPEDIYREYFLYFKTCAEQSAGDRIGMAYITHPANFGKRKKELVEKAAKLAGLLEIELIDEPTAAALCYCSKGKIKKGDKLLVYDFGGGTFDVALIEYDGNHFNPLTQALGIENCGGVDIDLIIFDDIIRSIPKEVTQPIESNKMARDRFYSQLMELSIKVKHQLSTLDSFEDGIAVGFDYINYKLTRQKLNELIKPMVDDTLTRVQDIVKNAGITMQDITTCVMVGGTCRVPYIKERLEKLTGRPAFQDIDPELAVCMGAALWKNREEVNVDEAIELYDKGKFAEALEIFQTAAEQNDMRAQYYIGQCYYYGIELVEDEYEAVKWYKKAADQGYLDALIDLGMCYGEGNGVTQNYKEAFRLFQLAADQGDKVAQYNLGIYYKNGRGVAEDKRQAFYWFKKSAEQGDMDAQLQVGMCYKTGVGISENLPEAVKWLHRSAEQGSAIAQSALADCYAFGKGVEENDEEASKWYLKAANQGDSDAQYYMGVSYSIGMGVPENDQEAFRWYHKAAEQGNVDAQYSLGQCYHSGTGVAKNDKEAAIWFRKAAEQGNEQAQYDLGILYANGYGVIKDVKEAFHWFMKSAEQGDAEAQYNVGIYYKNGDGVAKNETEAFKWFKKAAEQGDSDAQYKVGECYDIGCGVTSNETEAANWYRKSADQGNAEAQNSYGTCYYHGKGVSLDYAQAVSWFNKAASQGNVYSQYNLGLCHEYGNGVKINNETAKSWYQKAATQGYQKAIDKVAKMGVKSELEPLWSQLEELINGRQLLQADDMSKRILRTVANVNDFKSVEKANRIPKEDLIRMNNLWKQVSAGGLKDRQWFTRACDVNDYKALLSFQTFLEQRLANVL